jgi:hypothetical protein
MATVTAASVLKQAAAVSKKKRSDAMAIISYDEKPGIQAIATTAPDLPPVFSPVRRGDRPERDGQTGRFI